MSLEKALQENTEAMNRLADVIRAAGMAGCHTHSEDEVKKPAATPAATTPAAKVEPATESPSELTYDDIKKPFLQLANKDKPKAVALLAEMGVPSLQSFKDQPEKFADLLEAIKKASV